MELSFAQPHIAVPFVVNTGGDMSSSSRASVISWTDFISKTGAAVFPPSLRRALDSIVDQMEEVVVLLLDMSEVVVALAIRNKERVVGQSN